MTFELPKLPFPKGALAPYISEETIEYHYGKHHQAYITNLNKLIIDTEFEKKDLPNIIKTSSKTIFNNAAQAWNHAFYWNCLQPNTNENIPPSLAAALVKTFGSFEKFKEEFTKSALSLFGSGWTWLVKDRNGLLTIMNTSNAETPITTDNTPLLTCDVWEHAYYIDYRNARAQYLENFWKVVNWQFVDKNFSV
ncbi:MAG: Fe-Mn family superoxide dismutase [Gammaproteobacteria bacterium]|jgi:Fe-Mn family superoxide dismutase